MDAEKLVEIAKDMRNKAESLRLVYELRGQTTPHEMEKIVSYVDGIKDVYAVLRRKLDDPA